MAGRASQLIIQVEYTPSAAGAVASQVTTQAEYQPNSGGAVATQLVAQAEYQPNSGGAVATQLVAQVEYTPPNSRAQVFNSLLQIELEYDITAVHTSALQVEWEAPPLQDVLRVATLAAQASASAVDKSRVGAVSAQVAATQEVGLGSVGALAVQSSVAPINKASIETVVAQSAAAAASRGRVASVVVIAAIQSTSLNPSSELIQGERSRIKVGIQGVSAKTFTGQKKNRR